jgi:uncharacterized membrane protein YdjX (TVP38/TMEM64 family)
MAFRRNRNARSIVVAAGAFLVAAVGFRLTAGSALEPQVALDLVFSVRDRPWAWPVFVLAYLGLTSAFVPATLLHMVAGAGWGFRTGLLLNLVAFHLTSNLQFWAARRLGRSAVVGWVGEGPLARVEAKLAREGLRAAMLVRLLPLPNLAVNLAAGMSPIRWRDFALGTLVGTLPVIGVYTYFSAALAEGAVGAKRDALVHTLLGGALVLAIALITRLFSARARTD